MEVKRNLGGKDILPPPVSKTGMIHKKMYNSHASSKLGKGGHVKSSFKDTNPPKPAKSAKPSQHPPVTQSCAILRKTFNSQRKETGEGDKPETIVSIPPPQIPKPPLPPQVTSVASLLASAAVSSFPSSGQSSSPGSGAKSKLILNRCLHCYYTSYNMGNFNLHLDKHRGIMYICPEEGCPKDFGSVKARENHFKTRHLKKHRSECPFPDCNFSHNDHGVTKVHLYTDYGVGVEHKCRYPDCVDSVWPRLLLPVTRDHTIVYNSSSSFCTQSVSQDFSLFFDLTYFSNV